MLLLQCDHVVSSVHVVWLAPQGSGLSLVNHASAKLSSSSPRIGSLEKHESTISIRYWGALLCVVVVVVVGDVDGGCDSCVSGLTRREGGKRGHGGV